MEFRFEARGDCLTIELYGSAGANEHLLSRGALIRELEKSPRTDIVDLSSLKEQGNPYVLPYILRVINTIIKEVQFLGGAIWLSSLKPKVYHYLLSW